MALATQLGDRRTHRMEHPTGQEHNLAPSPPTFHWAPRAPAVPSAETRWTRHGGLCVVVNEMSGLKNKETALCALAASSRSTSQFPKSEMFKGERDSYLYTW